MTKNKKVIIPIVLALIFVFSFIYFFKENFQFKGTVEEVFSLSAVVSGVDVENNFLMAKPIEEENEVKVVLSETTKLIKLESPFSSDNPPEPGTQFTPEQTEIIIEDFREGDEIFIKTLKNIAGKIKFNDVEFIQILP